MPKRSLSAAASTDSTEPMTVVCFGDSNTHGQSSDAEVRMALADRWTTHLQRTVHDNFTIICEGLNGRTTVHDDPIDSVFAGIGGVNLNGRRYLLPCLHSHKPVHTVVLGLGANDLKARFNLSAADIRRGLRTLLSDIKQSGAGPDGGAPTIVVLSPPKCKDTATNAEWGFSGCASKSVETIKLYREECAAQGLPFVDLSEVASVGKDGVHFTAAAAIPIAEAVAMALMSLYKNKWRAPADDLT